VAKTTRKVIRGAKALPVLGAADDAIMLRNRVPEIVDAIRGEPQNPIFHWWLADALDRAEAERAEARHATRYWGGLYGVVSRAATRTIIGALAGPGESEGSPAYVQSKRAFAVAMTGLRRDPTDPRHADALGRLYTRLGHPQDAMECARTATLADPTYANGFVTLAQAYLCAGRTDDARRAAAAAIEGGQSVGFQVFAQLGGSPPSSPSQEDLVAYYGPAPLSPKETVKAVGRAQAAKARRITPSGRAPSEGRPTGRAQGSTHQWIPDPSDPNLLREWTGDAWTGRTARLGDGQGG
jgi:tetratricopeptide (TPR) repeat protein